MQQNVGQEYIGNECIGAWPALQNKQAIHSANRKKSDQEMAALHFHYRTYITDTPNAITRH